MIWNVWVKILGSGGKLVRWEKFLTIEDYTVTGIFAREHAKRIVAEMDEGNFRRNYRALPPGKLPKPVKRRTS